ncbi:MAG: insulinase family protein, partial [Prevotellaceae bacterium]|nr:insulinase family protein [Prevotellaceae bacterium]
VKKKKQGIFGSTEWTLSNGMKVIIKQTDFKKDQILMGAISEGGKSLLDEKDVPTLLVINNLMTIGGMGNFSNTDLKKVLAGKKASVKPEMSYTTETFSGSSSPADFETMLQLTYLYMTSPRADNEAFEAYISRGRNALKNAELNPNTTMSDSIISTLWNNHPRKKRMKLPMLDSINYSLAQQMYRERFMNNDLFTFVFVGNINPDSVQLLVEKYLGALPKVKGQETFRPVGILRAKGEKSNIFDRKIETPKTSAYVYYSGKCDYTLKNSILMSILNQSLRIIYTEKVREEEGGTYGVKVSGSISRFVKPNFKLQISFDTNPEMVEKLMQIIYAEIDSIVANGVREVDFLKVKEFMQKKITENKAENSYWLNALVRHSRMGLDFATDYETTLNAITIEDVREFAKYIFGQKNRVEVIMNPE